MALEKEFENEKILREWTEKVTQEEITRAVTVLTALTRAYPEIQEIRIKKNSNVYLKIGGKEQLFMNLNNE